MFFLCMGLRVCEFPNGRFIPRDTELPSSAGSRGVFLLKARMGHTPTLVYVSLGLGFKGTFSSPHTILRLVVPQSVCCIEDSGT
jgi:hypothetical protein